MDAFSPITALIGGAMLGLGSAVLWLGNGRIAGISGIFGNVLSPARTMAWRVVFLAGMVIAAFGLSRMFPGLATGSGPDGASVLIGNPLWIGVSGLLVGIGTRIGSGCTSGHGVCGIARLSFRSMTAVAIFFSVAIATVTITGVV